MTLLKLNPFKYPMMGTPKRFYGVLDRSL